MASAFVVLIGASSIPSTSAVAIPSSFDHFPPTPLLMLKRHGDEEHEDSHDDMEAMDGMRPTPSSIVDVHPALHTISHTGASETMNSSASPSHHPHGGGHAAHSHTDEGGSMYDVIPDPLRQSSDTFIVIPPLPYGAGGHSHGGSHKAEAPKEELNETVIVRWKGPDPLSYVEWDFTYGIGRTDDLSRFSKAVKETTEKDNIMGVGGERWRTLVDEWDASQRSSIASDISQRVQESPQDPGRHWFLMILHVAGCIVSCFILLPVALALRSAHSNLAPAASLVYLVCLSGSLFMSQFYKAMTPRLYPVNAHSGIGYAIFWLSLLALGGDVFKLLVQMYRVFKGIRRSSGKVTLRTLIKAISTTPKSSVGDYDALEEERMLSPHHADSDTQEVEQEANKRALGSDSSSVSSHRVHFAQDHEQHARNESTRPANGSSSSRHGSADLPSPSSTLCNTPRTSLLGELHHARLPKLFTSTQQQTPGNNERVTSWRRSHGISREGHHHQVSAKRRRSTRQILALIVRYTHVTIARSIPVVSFAAAYTGLAVYTGSCRGPYANTCMAHGIKGGIFFWYGLLSFGRYLGAYADVGWAWNKQPVVSKDSGSAAVSAEWVECFVIFLYGATNTWMERFGAAPGDPYSVKQVQHISIAVMFWFAGLMGLILETKRLKNLLAIPVVLKQARINAEGSGRHGSVTCEEALALPARPPSYNFSFNPFPALVIGVTGVAMAAHHQDYAYEVAIHSLWGNLLAGFSIFRVLTYFFLFLRPPTGSIMPSRPPSEALASFCLASGGLVFMLSTEEVSYVAMRNGFGDFMMILNVTVATVSLVFCGIAGLMILKAFALRREKMREEAEEAASIRLEDVPSTSSDAPASQQSVFVLEDENESNEEKRQLASSPIAI